MVGDLREAVGRVLDGLPACPDDVARALEGRGLRGRRRDPERCPLASHVRLGLPGHRVQRVLVGSVGVMVWADGRTAMLALPEHLAEFVRALDDDAYPSLRV